MIRNPYTGRAYARAASDFLTWRAGAGVTSIAAVQPRHEAAWIEWQTQALSAPSVKQHLAAIRHLFDWLVVDQIVPHNLAVSVRVHSTSLDATEARQLLYSIDVTTPVSRRDSAQMVFSFARVGAALAMRVEGVYAQQQRLWVRLTKAANPAVSCAAFHSFVRVTICRARPAKR